MVCSYNDIKVVGISQIPLRSPGRRPAASWNLAYHALSSELARGNRSATGLGPVCDQDSVVEFGFYPGASTNTRLNVQVTSQVS